MPAIERNAVLQIPVQLDSLTVWFFINQNLHASGGSEYGSVPHNHHDFELRYVESGVGNQYVSGELYRLSRGNCLVVLPLEYHWQAGDPRAHASSQFNLRFSVKAPPKNNARAIEDYEQLMGVLRDARVLQDRDGRLLAVFRRISDELARREGGFVQILRALCLQLLVEAVRLAGGTLRCFETEELYSYGHERGRLDLFFQDRYLTPNIKVQHLAEELNVSVRQVNYILHKMYGKSFVQKITEMRMQQAARLLAFTDRPILAISQSCGFQNQNYFAKCFQREYQMTPSQYRKAAGKAREEAQRRPTEGK